jgi:hypothetical protein
MMTFRVQPGCEIRTGKPENAAAIRCERGVEIATPGFPGRRLSGTPEPAAGEVRKLREDGMRALGGSRFLVARRPSEVSPYRDGTDLLITG